MGFSGGNNLILRRRLRAGRAKFFFLLNIDTQIDPDCLYNLVEFFKADRQAGMVEAVQRPREHPKMYDPETFETSWCSGGGVLISTEALKNVGVFDDRFFLYCEDVDLSWRMWLCGWKCKINPSASYQHFTESLDREKDLSVQQYYSMRNSFYMHYKYDTADGIKKHTELFKSVLPAQDEVSKKILLKAYQDAKKNYYRFIPDRLKRPTYPSLSWIKFNGFDFGDRREFFDTEDGKRVMLA